MTNKEYIELFYDRTQEKYIDEKILDDKNYIVPRKKILEYIKHVLSIPYIEYINYLTTIELGAITTEQLTQCSAFSAFTDDMCKALDWKGNPGLHFVEIGQLFPQYIQKHNETAYRKYGENQVKTSAQLGLTFEYFDHWYLTCVGYVFNELTCAEKKSFLARTVLRIPLYANMLLSLLQKDVNLADYLQTLSDSTKIRRTGSILKLFQLCIDECKKEDIVYHNFQYPHKNSNSKTLSSKIIKGTYTDIPTKRVYNNPAKGRIPLYSLRAACGYFSDGEKPELEGWVDISGHGIKPNPESLFVVYAKGNSMLPRIHNGDLCIFEWMNTTPDEGSIVLIQSTTYDSEYNGKYTIKKIYGEKEWNDGLVSYSKIILHPLNHSEYKPIILTPNSDIEYKIIGVLKGIISSNE